jgi:hypothetical protein
MCLFLAKDVSALPANCLLNSTITNGYPRHRPVSPMVPTISRYSVSVNHASWYQHMASADHSRRY